MRTTSFGYMTSFSHSQDKTIEYLEFYSEGRFHKHPTEEWFTVLKGRGKLIIENESIDIYEGETYKVPRGKNHKMTPEKGCLKVLVTYES